MKRFVLIALLACFLVGMCGCSCGPGPQFTFRNPLLIDNEAQTSAAPRLMQAPAYYAPTYTPAAAPVPASGFNPCP